MQRTRVCILPNDVQDEKNTVANTMQYIRNLHSGLSSSFGANSRLRCTVVLPSSLYRLECTFSRYTSYITTTLQYYVCASECSFSHHTRIVTIIASILCMYVR